MPSRPARTRVQQRRRSPSCADASALQVRTFRPPVPNSDDAARTVRHRQSPCNFQGRVGKVAVGLWREAPTALVICIRRRSLAPGFSHRSLQACSCSLRVPRYRPNSGLGRVASKSPRQLDMVPLLADVWSNISWWPGALVSVSDDPDTANVRSGMSAAPGLRAPGGVGGQLLQLATTASTLSCPRPESATTRAVAVVGHHADCERLAVGGHRVRHLIQP